MSNAIIRAALETRLKSIAEGDFQTPPPIAYQNAPFTRPSPSVTWLECFLIPTASLPRSTDGTVRTFIGIFQVNIWIPKSGGMRLAEAGADIISEGFSVDKRDSAYPKLSVTGVSTGRALNDPAGWVGTPVLISYRYDE